MPAGTQRVAPIPFQKLPAPAAAGLLIFKGPQGHPLGPHRPSSLPDGPVTRGGSRFMERAPKAGRR